MSFRRLGTIVSMTLAFLLLFVLLFSPLASAASIGDLDGDGDINVQDVVLVMRHVLELDSLTPAQEILADVNHDGVINVSDVVLIMRRALGIVTEFPEPTQPAGQMTVHFIDVGQGDSILIEAPAKTVLIDGGNRGNTVVNYLNNLGIKELDLVIGTHPHADHIGGLINILENIKVKEVIDPGVVHTTKTFEDYLDIIDEKDIIFTEGRVGMSRDLGVGARLTILHPADPEGQSLNNASVVARVVFNQVSFLFTGDAEKEAEAEMLNRVYTLDSDVLKVGHHGSRTSTTQAFLDAVSPTSAVIMCALNNAYGHPHQETLDKLGAAEVDIYRTDLHGTIIFTTDGKTYQVDTKPYVPEPDPVEMVDINTASFEELQLIIHVGPDRAQQIIALRPFESLDGLLQVDGIGPSRLQDIKDQGVAYVYNPVAVTGLSLSSSSITLRVGETAKLTATITPSNATNRNLSWAISNTSVATITAEGLESVKVSPSGVGSATIIVTTADGGYTATCSITVLPAEDPVIKVVVPRLIGEQEEAARQMVTDAELGVGDVSYEYSTTAPQGQVIRQNPAVGATVNKGSLVSIVVSRGPEPAPDPPPPDPDPDPAQLN